MLVEHLSVTFTRHRGCRELIMIDAWSSTSGSDTFSTVHTRSFGIPATNMRQCLRRPANRFPLRHSLLTLEASSIILSCTNKSFLLTFMSQAHATASSSSSTNFQLIMNNALDKYKKRTKTDLITHPLAAQLQSCNSPTEILAVLQQQVQGLDQSRSSDERWSRWLDPTVNVIYVVSSTLAAGVSLVCLKTRAFPRSAHSYPSGRCSRPRMSYSLGLASSFQCVSFFMASRGPF